MPEACSESAGGSRPCSPRTSCRSWPGAVVVGLIAAAVFGSRLSSEPHFADESAYYSQSYFAGLFVSGRWEDPAWLSYPAYDLPPLPKYLIGSALWVGGYRVPGPAEALAWYQDTSSRSDLLGGGGLTAARIPIVLVGSMGCVAVYGIGVLAAGRRVGLIAGLLIVANPLYRMLARRAMSDAPCEAFLDVALFAMLWAWKGAVSGRSQAPSLLGGTSAGIAAGLALLSKMSGMLFFLVVAGWAALAVLARVPVGRKLTFSITVCISTLVATATFVALDPFLTARPARRLPDPVAAIRDLTLIERARLLFELRRKVSADQQRAFAHNAVRTWEEKVSTVAVQGFGRFGLFGPTHSDSTERFDLSQDWGAFLWLPWVAWGGVGAWKFGGEQARAGAPPTAWALLVMFMVSLVVISAYLPMAWDRYFLALQAPSALLAAVAAARVWDRVARLHGTLSSGARRP